MPSGSWAQREWYPRFAGRSERHCAVAEQAVQLAQPATWMVAARHTGTRTIAKGYSEYCRGGDSAAQPVRSGRRLQRTHGHGTETNKQTRLAAVSTLWPPVTHRSTPSPGTWRRQPRRVATPHRTHVATVYQVATCRPLQHGGHTAAGLRRAWPLSRASCPAGPCRPRAWTRGTST